MVGTAGTGSTAGFRFNPRQSAEELEEDSSVGREDSEERALHDAKKREQQDKRAKMMQGIQHMKVKIPQKHEEDEEDSDMKQQAELGQMTGQVGQSEAIDGANPNAGGLGTNIMLSSSAYIDEAFEIIRKKRDKPAYDTDKPEKTTTLSTVRARARAKTGKKRKSRKNVTVESLKRRRRRKGSGIPLKAGNVRQPGSMASLAGARAPYASFGGGYTYRQPTRFVRLSGSSGRSRAKQSYPDPRQREAEAERQQIRQTQPTQDLTPPTPTMTLQSRLSKPPRGRGRKKLHAKATRQPRTTATPGGQEETKSNMFGGGASAMAAGGIGSTDSILASEEFLKGRAQKLKLGISPRDRMEYRRLMDNLNVLMRRLMRKEDKTSTPNSSGGETSNPTGATETDPDDDATRWGAHAYDLYVRRGGIG